MSLNLFIPSIQRVKYALSSSATASHPLHAILSPLLQTTRTTADKYRTDLPKILFDGAGTGDIEESMILYAFHHQIGSEDSDEQWREKWLERMEHRE